MKVLVCLAALVAASVACPDLSVVTPLDVPSFVGTWRQWASLGSFIFQGDGNCAKAQYTLDTDTGIIGVNNTEVQPWLGVVEIDGWATLADNDTQAGVLRVTLDTLVGEVTSDLAVLDTDYVNYAVLWSCKRVLFWETSAAWILTREANPSNTTTALIQTSLDNIAQQGGPSLDDFSLTNQDDCIN